MPKKSSDRKRLRHGVRNFVVFLILCVIAAAIVFVLMRGESRQPKPIPSASVDAPRLVGTPAKPHSVHTQMLLKNPFMGKRGVNSMHGDGGNTNAQTQMGPLGRDPQVISRKEGGVLPGSCPITTVTHAGKLVVLCGGLFHFKFELLDPKTLDLLASYTLPTRPSSYHAMYTLNPKYIMSDTSGAYFYLDQHDRIVYANAKQHIVRIAIRHKHNGDWSLQQVNDWDMSAHLPHDCWGLLHWSPQGTCDPITAVLPDFKGKIWWASRQGRVGVLNPKTGHVAVMRLKGEQIQNGFAVGRNGVYIVSDHAMYGFRENAAGAPEVVWRKTYDRGDKRKVGSINQGSGTTPTLLGKKYVAITDNADPRLHVLVYRRQPDVKGKRLVCSVPIFKPGASATDNTMVGADHALIVENNAGYGSAFNQSDWAGIAGGIWRVNVLPGGSGCKVAWKSPEKSPSVVPKMSLANGLVYFYTFKPLDNGKNAWYLLALDFATGKTQFKIRTGVGSAYDNNWSPITLGPDGAAYVGTYKGMVAIRDGS